MGSKLPARLIAVAVGKFHNTDAALAPANCTLPFRNTAAGPMTLITTAEVDGALIALRRLPHELRRTWLRDVLLR